MTLLDAAVHVAALVLAVAGVAKLTDPRPVTRSLAAARLPSSPLVGRLIGTGEVVVGGGALAVGGRLAAVALGAWYVAFVVYLVSNRLRGLDVPCGCIGESDRPAGPAHLVVDLLAGTVAFAAVARPVAGAADWLDEGGLGIAVLVAIVAISAAIVTLVLRER